MECEAAAPRFLPLSFPRGCHFPLPGQPAEPDPAGCPSPLSSQPASQIRRVRGHQPACSLTIAAGPTHDVRLSAGKATGGWFIGVAPASSPPHHSSTRLHSTLPPRVCISAPAPFPPCACLCLKRPPFPWWNPGAWPPSPGWATVLGCRVKLWLAIVHAPVLSARGAGSCPADSGGCRARGRCSWRHSFAAWWWAFFALLPCPDMAPADGVVAAAALSSLAAAP